MGTGVAVDHTHLYRLIDLAKCLAHGGLDSCLCFGARLAAVGITGGEAALHQCAQG